jgi:hypothetical protein
MVLCGLFAGGCSLVPDARPRARFHNPLPQLHRVAILPFFNQSDEPTLNQIDVAEAYYAELQAIPGFEVVPIGVSVGMVEDYALGMNLVDPRGQIAWGRINFQELAAAMGVDALVVGSITDYDPYYPPRLAMTTRWYAANPAFHPVPAGYGLPWGTKAEKKIPRRILLETELAVARAQMATQTPSLADLNSPAGPSSPAQTPPPPTAVPSREVGPQSGSRDDSREEMTEAEMIDAFAVSQAGGEVAADELFDTRIELEPMEFPVMEIPAEECDPSGGEFGGGGMIVAAEPPTAPLPVDWPDPSRLIPDAPNPLGAPPALPQSAPVMSHTRIYRGDDPDFTEKLADHVYAMDEARLGGWQGYLNRSDDFIRFCCYLHITEMLEMRGGRDQSDLIIRWPISRYTR